jgi:lactate permease
MTPRCRRRARAGPTSSTWWSARWRSVHAICGTLIPLLLVMFMTRFFGRNRRGPKAWRSCRSRCSRRSPSPSPTRWPACSSARSSRRCSGPDRPGVVSRGGARRLPGAQEELGLRRPEGVAGRVDGQHRDEARPDRQSHHSRRWLAWLPYLLLAAILVAEPHRRTVQGVLLSVNFSARNILGETASAAASSRCTCRAASWCSSAW